MRYLTLVLMSLPCLQAVRSEQNLRVCDVLSQIARYRNTTVTVRGIVFSDYHGSCISDGFEPACGSNLAPPGQQWPSAIYIVWPEEKVPDGGERSWTPEPATIRETLSGVRSIIEADRKEGRNNLFYALSIVGDVVSRPNISIVRHQDGWYGGNGYGQGGQYPAALIVRSVSNPEIVEAQSVRGYRARKSASRP
jgi:hypothetical protein